MRYRRRNVRTPLLEGINLELFCPRSASPQRSTVVFRELCFIRMCFCCDLLSYFILRGYLWSPRCGSVGEPVTWVRTSISSCYKKHKVSKRLFIWNDWFPIWKDGFISHSRRERCCTYVKLNRLRKVFEQCNCRCRDVISSLSDK
jgi:hypothetical protein